MDKLFHNQGYERPIYKHINLPLIITDEFDFYRCIEFNDSFYGKTVSQLHIGNLRKRNNDNRYSKLFSGKYVSYWSDSLKTARAEFFYHHDSTSYISFWAYDDASSSFPTSPNKQALIIVDGRLFGFSSILHKFEEGIPFTREEKQIIKEIEHFSPDCLAFESLRNKDGLNFLFFEKGFKKLSLREVTLHIRNKKKRNKNTIVCSFGSDYTPIPQNYGKVFAPIAKIKDNADYLNTPEFIQRNTLYETEENAFFKQIRAVINESHIGEKKE